MGGNPGCVYGGMTLLLWGSRHVKGQAISIELCLYPMKAAWHRCANAVCHAISTPPLPCSTPASPNKHGKRVALNRHTSRFAAAFCPCFFNEGTLDPTQNEVPPTRTHGTVKQHEQPYCTA
eukprot:1136295-Pelagomonas_calceolata.AAC.1